MYIQPQKSDEIFHYGIKRRSGRYPWGSGGRPYQRLEGKVKSFIKGDMYEKKEIARLRTGLEYGARAAVSSAIGGAAGLAVGVGTQNYLLGMATYNTVVSGMMLSPVGKMNVYFKKEKEQPTE